MTNDITATPLPPTPALPEVEGTLEREDYLAEQAHLSERGSIQWGRRIARGTFFVLAGTAGLLVIVVFGVLVTWLILGAPVPLVVLFGLGVGLLGGCIIIWVGVMAVDDLSREGSKRRHRWTARWRIRFLVWAGQIRLGNRYRCSLSAEEFVQVIEFEEQGYGRIRVRIEQRIPWEVIRAIGVTEEHLFLILDRKQAFTIPARWFPDQVAFDDYGRTAWGNWVGATKAPDAPFPGDSQAIRHGAE